LRVPSVRVTDGRTRPRLDRNDSSTIILGYLFHQLVDVHLVDLHELFAPSAEIVYVAGIYVKPQGVYVQVVRLQTLLEETIAGDVLQLLQSVDL